ncbi:MAG TPA: efflux transporter outer membrane subunit [Rhizomicrobium sp.]|nr:efflux transporter outer membrane subunit [Rhizomicrobium sp.]
MSKAFRLIVPAIAAVLAGCSTPVPQSLAPQMVPKVFTGPVPAAAQVWPEVSWWKTFGDPQLTGLIEAAQADNRDVAIAAARVMQAEAQSTIQRSALFPQIGAQADHRSSGCSGQSCQTFAKAKAFDLSFNASYELDFWGLARDNLRAADEQLKSARFAQVSVALTVTANVANQYLNVLAIRRRIAIANDNIAAINNILDVIKLKVKAGAASHLDLAREQAQVEAGEAQLPGLETLEKQALFSLAVLLGRVPEGFDVKAIPLDTILAPVVGAGLPSDLLLRRPDIAQAEADLAAAHANVDAARAAFLPQISLTGSGGFVSTAIGTLLQGSNFGYSYGANLLQAIFDGGKLAGQKDLAEGVQREFIASYQSAALNAYADVENALAQVANTGRAQDHLEREVKAAREAFEISQLQYRQGAADLLTVLQAQQTLFSAEDQLVQIVLANRQSAIHLYEALGGGWMENQDDRTQFVRDVSIQQDEKRTSAGAK